MTQLSDLFIKHVFFLREDSTLTIRIDFEEKDERLAPFRGFTERETLALIFHSLSDFIKNGM